MKWVKVAIGAVIAIISIGIIATSVHSMTQGKLGEEVVTFTVNVTDETVTPNVFNEIAEFILVDDVTGYATNVIEAKLNGIIANDLFIGYDDDYKLVNILSESLDGGDAFDNNGDYIVNDGVFQDGDILTFTFEVTKPAQLTGITATLILLTPLIFAGGILAYLLNKQEV